MLRLIPRKTIVAILVLACVTAGAHAAELEFGPDDGLKLSSDDGSTFLRLGARLHADAAWFESDQTQLEDDAIFRRARLSARGRLNDNWRMAFSYDFGEVPGIKSAWLRYSGFDNLHLTAGNQIAPFSLEENTSSDNLTFMERSLSTAFSPGFLVGLAARANGDSWTVTAGFYGDEIDDRQRRKGDGTSFAGRMTWAPFKNSKGHLLHLGVSGEYRRMSDELVRFRTRPESFVTPEKLIDTRTIEDTDALTTLAVEAAWRYRRLSLQGEYVTTDVKRIASPALAFDGGYLSASLFLTDNRRGYRRSTGTFGRFAGSRRNAWEIGVRYSFADLSDQDIEGGREQNLTLGLNWYIDRNLRIMINYVQAELSPNRNGVDESPSLIQMRFQARY